MDKHFTLMLILVSFILFYLTLTQGLCKYLSNTFTWPCVHVLEHVGVYTRVIHKVILVMMSWKFKHGHPLKILHNIDPPPPKMCFDPLAFYEEPSILVFFNNLEWICHNF
jgi:hypothetical protein